MIDAWWMALNMPLKVFYAVALTTSALLVLQLLLAIFGFDHDHDVDTAGGIGDFDDASDAGGGVLSIRTITAFFTGFGWGGVVALRQGFGVGASVALATVAGGVLMAAVFFLMRGIYGLRYSGTLDYSNAVGNVGNVYVTVPGAMAGSGQVEVQVQGRLSIIRAFTRNPQPISTRTPVRVVGVLDQQTVLVDTLDRADAATPKEG